MSRHRAMTCDYCGAETSNGLALCQACRAWLLVNLEFIPVYFRNLSRWRPSSASGVRRVPGSREPMGPSVGTPDRIARLLDESHADLTGWARTLADDRPQLSAVIARILTFEEEPAVRLVCALLIKYADSLATLPWVRDIVAGVAEVERRLRNETERAVPGWYAGACRHCTVPTYVVPGLTWVTCQGCGAMTYAADHLEVILDEARDWIARPKTIAQALVALVDTEQSVPRLHTRIRQWAYQGDLPAIRAKTRGYAWSDAENRVVVVEAEGGHARYRFGEVLSLVLRDTRSLHSKRARDAAC